MDEDNDETRRHFEWQLHFGADWKTDRAGVCHWTGQAGDVYEAALKCLESRPASGPEEPAWFWWNGTPAPIASGDGRNSLAARWHAWRSAYQAGGSAFLDLLIAWSLGA